ncbi:MAG: dynamin family protein, partial [Thermoplasmata archaeon]
LIADLREKLREEKFNIVVLGGFKRGKSTLINAMIGSRVLPMGVIPLTSVITKLSFGKKLHAEVSFGDGKKASIDTKSIEEYVTERLNPNNVKNVVEVDIQINSDLLEQGVVIVDTPGIGSTFTRNTLVTYDFLSKVDAAFFILGVEPPISQTELDFLNDIRSQTDRLFIVLNKVDMMAEKDRAEVLEFSERVLTEAMGGAEPEIFPLSAKLALEAREAGDQDKLKRSGYIALENKLREFLAKGKAEALLANAKNRLMRAASDLLTAVEIEQRIVSEPVAAMDEKMEWLRREIRAAKRKLEEFEVLMNNRVARMIEHYTDRLEEVKRQAAPRLLRDLDERIRKMPEKSGRREYLEALQTHIAEAIEETYEPFVKSVSAEISRGLASAVDDILSGADRYSRDFEARVAEMFGIETRITEGLSIAVDRTTFYFDQISILRCDSIVPPELPMVLPKRLYRKAIGSKAKEIMLSELEKHAGRIRYDFDYRLSESARRVNAEIRNRMLSTIDSLEGAYLMGLKSRNEASQERDARLVLLKDIEGRLKALLEKMIS